MAWRLRFLAQEEADDMWPATTAAGRTIWDVPFGGAIPVGGVAWLCVFFVAFGFATA